MVEQPKKTAETDGTIIYQLANGDLHREDGPAIIWSSDTKAWYRNGVRHREEAAAVIWPSGTKEYWLKGKRLQEGDLALKLIKEREKRSSHEHGNT